MVTHTHTHPHTHRQQDMSSTRQDDRLKRQERQTLSAKPKNADECAAGRVIRKQDAVALAAAPAGHHAGGFNRRTMLEKISGLLQGNIPYKANGLGVVRDFWSGLSSDERLRTILEMVGGDTNVAKKRRASAKHLGFPL